MTEEKMHVPKDVEEDARRMAKEDNIPLDRIISYMREEYFDEVIATAFPDPMANNGERARQALLCARSRIAAEKGNEDTTYKGVILVKGPTECDVSKRTGNSYVSRSIHGIFAKDGEKPSIQKIMLFGDAVEQIEDVPEKELIEINFTEKDDDKYGVSLSANKLFWNKSDKTVDIRQMLTSTFGDKKTVNEMEFSQGETDKDGNFKKILLECRVKSVNIKESKESDFRYVTYGVYSDEDGPEKMAYIRAPTSMAVCDEKSLIWVVGENKPKNEKYKDSKPSLWADIIYPIVRFPLIPTKVEAMMENAAKRKQAQANNKTANNSVTIKEEGEGLGEVDEGSGWDL